MLLYGAAAKTTYLNIKQQIGTHTDILYPHSFLSFHMDSQYDISAGDSPGFGRSESQRSNSADSLSHPSA